MAMRPSRFIWYELMTSDPDDATRFYAAAVGWTVKRAMTPGLDYREWAIGGQAVGGLMAIPQAAAAAGMPPQWLGYVDVPDVDACLDALTRAGGSIHMPATDLPGIGRIAMVADPQGAAFYVMAPSGTDSSQSFAPGKPGHGGWHELHTTDWAAALAFYSAHFGWHKASALDLGAMGTYLLFNTGAEVTGGMMNGPGPRRAWLYYFNVDDIDAARLRVEEAGGAVLAGPHEVPGGGWIIHARDPQGAMFGLLGPATAGV